MPRPQGEVFYSAPEMLLGEVVDAWADVFSLGLTLLEFATGRHLYDPGLLRIEEVESRMSQAEREQAFSATVASVVAELPDFAEDAIGCAMAFRSDDVEHAAQGLSFPFETSSTRFCAEAPPNVSGRLSSWRSSCVASWRDWGATRARMH
ncbi:hypothetical protein QEG98_11515 [Myxococcus sp. MxC21-1]|uniref:hypothetical protein n=1 Tax=Myxococcus sp. MxC21-1 TaxID=3041439 RepID=UPI00292EFB2D|nr:hypothetical protein [Myxococcus sp. MxC21-1]WNZ64239.1 hypothetical protein QEG98_11515 [Myxococcus sp. MxC21-1]